MFGLLLSLTLAVPTNVQVVFEARELANLTAHLDCLAGVRRCARQVYQQLWKKEMGLSTEDEKRFEEWRSALNPEVDWSPIAQRPEVSFPLPAHLLTPENSLRVAGLQARDVVDYEERLNLVAEPKVVGRLVKLLGFFAPRFHPFWLKAQPELDRAVRSAQALMRDKALQAYVDKVAHFYAAELPPGHTVHMSLIFRPKAQSRNTHAEQMSGYSAVEVVEGEAIESRMDVVLHELFHYFYQEASDSVHVDIIDTMAKSAMADAFNAYSLMNETFATALGQGVVSKMVAPKNFDKNLTTARGFYNDEIIDRAAKSTLPLVEAWVERGEQLSGARAETFRAMMNQTFGAQLRSVTMGLRSHVVTYTGEGVKALTSKLMEANRTTLQRSVAPMDSPEAIKEFFAHRDLNGVLMMTKAEFPRLKAWEPHFGAQILERLRELSGKQAGFVYGVRRTDKAITYVLVGEDAETIAELITKLSAVAEPFTGPGPTVSSYTK